MLKMSDNNNKAPDWLETHRAAQESGGLGVCSALRDTWLDSHLIWLLNHWPFSLTWLPTTARAQLWQRKHCYIRSPFSSTRTVAATKLGLMAFQGVPVYGFFSPLAWSPLSNYHFDKNEFKLFAFCHQSVTATSGKKNISKVTPLLRLLLPALASDLTVWRGLDVIKEGPQSRWQLRHV